MMIDGGSSQIKQHMRLADQKQANLAEAIRTSVAIRELAHKDHDHRLQALLWRFTAWRARRRGAATEGYRSWDH